MVQAEAGVVAPVVSVVVPVYNGERCLPRCLEALASSRGVAWELIVVDDGSTDDSARIAERYGARVLRTDRPRSGPGIGRNVGAAQARGALLCFVDADVVVQPDTLAAFAALFADDPDLAAAFGSYDAQPAVREHLSEYRNLLHHFVHQTGREAASTFWAGCGVVRRDLFQALGGFNAAYGRPSIEDIELGYRLRAAGHRIRLARHIQVTHLKRWTFWGILKTDVCDRALPWTALIRRTGRLPNDLNLDVGSRLSAASVFALVGVLGLDALGILSGALAWLAPLPPLAILLVCNRALYRFLLAERGLGFLLRSLPMHWLYFAYSSLAFAAGMLLGERLERAREGRAARDGGAARGAVEARIAIASGAASSQA